LGIASFIVALCGAWGHIITGIICTAFFLGFLHAALKNTGDIKKD
jgi:hypothetical protein